MTIYKHLNDEMNDDVFSLHQDGWISSDTLNAMLLDIQKRLNDFPDDVEMNIEKEQIDVEILRLDNVVRLALDALENHGYWDFSLQAIKHANESLVRALRDHIGLENRFWSLQNTLPTMIDGPLKAWGTEVIDKHEKNMMPQLNRDQRLGITIQLIFQSRQHLNKIYTYILPSLEASRPQNVDDSAAEQ